MTKSRATVIGFSAILLWSLLAVLTVGSAPVPPLLLNAICFSIGGALGLGWSLATGGLKRLRGVSWKIYGFGTLGLFGYHALYFSALRHAPAAEAGLIAYLWPLLIVIFSGFLPGEHLKPGHIIGAVIGFCGAALIILGGQAGFNTAALPGYAMALACAFTWAGYSVLSRRFGSAPTDSVAVFCLAAAILSGVLHLFIEQTVWPTGAIGWASVIMLGLGPVGLAFFVWDIGVKHGDIQILGAASYAAPMLSTLVLISAGFATPSWALALATCLITGGAALAARASFAVKP